MTCISRALVRALILAAVTSAALGVGLLAGAASASAHVTVDADVHAPGEWAVLTFEVPNESENGSLTTALSVAMPPGTSAMTEAMPGWTAKLDRDSEVVRSVTWTASPGTGIAPDQFALFRVSLKLPNTDNVSFAASQTYSDGTVVRWDQPPLPDGGEPERPAPMLALSAAAPQSQNDIDATFWLAVAALIVGAAGVVLALVRRRS